MVSVSRVSIGENQSDTMNDSIRNENRPIPLRRSCGKSFSSSKIKHRHAEKFPENDTPVSKLCATMIVATLQTPTTCSEKAEEAMVVETPLKLSHQIHVGSPSLPFADKHAVTEFQTPIQFPLFDSENMTRETPNKTPLNSPGSFHLNSVVETPLCFALDKANELKNVNTTPRRNPRRSCLDKSSLKIFEEMPSKQVRRSSILKNKCESNLSVTKIIHCQNNIPTTAPLQSDNVTSLGNENGVLLQKETASYVTCSRKSLFCETGSNNILVNSLDSNSSFQIEKNLQSKVSSESRVSKKTVSGGYSSRRLSFSAKKSENKRKSIVPEYDPENDIFAHGIMPVQFNVDLLKQEIGKIFSASDISSPILKKSKSCVTLNEVHENDDITQIRNVTPVSPRKKQSKQVTRFSSERKRTLSAPNVLVSAETETKSCVKMSSEGTMRAYLRARDIIKNLKQRAKNICNVPNQVKKSATSQLTSANHLQSCVDNVSSQSNAVAVKGKNVEEDAWKESEKESLNCSSEDMDLSPTQPFESIILRGVTAYVEVISKNEDISAGVRTELIKLGATVVPSFNRNVPVTHVIFNDGHISTYNKAKKRNIPLVSVLWIEECRKAGLKVNESFFPPYQIERYECPSIVKELKKRRILHFYSDRNPRPSPRQKKVIPKSTAVVPLNETPPQNGSEKKCYHMPKWIDEVAGNNGELRVLVSMTGIGQNEFKELINRPPTPDSDLELEQNSPLSLRLLRKLAKKLPVKERNVCASSIDLIEGTSQTNNPCVENSFVRKLDGMEIEKAENIESVSTQHESAAIYQVSPSELSNITQRRKIATKTDNFSKNNLIEKTTQTSRRSFKSYFVKEQNEILKPGRDEMCNNEIENAENNERTISQHKSSVHSNLVSQLESSELQDVSQRKRVSKRKLLSPIEEAMVAPSDVEYFSTENREIENPHSQPLKQLEGGKKKKSEVVENEPSKIVSDCGMKTNEEIVVSETNETNSEVPVRRSRRSSIYFVKVKRKCPSPIVQKPGLVCTLLHSADLEFIANIVEKLGSFVMEKNVTSQTTHIITGSSKRTMKVLKGMARGCWIVDFEWVLKSLEANKWLDEEDFELTSFSPAVQKYRLEKLSFGGIFKPDIFSKCGQIFVSSQSRAPRSDLVELILLCGGKISSKISKAQIAVGKICPGLVCVTDLWILDSVQYYSCKSFDSYLYS